MPGSPYLQKVPVRIPLGVGLRTDIDPKLLPLGAMLELENARYARTGEIVKRYGTTALPNDVNNSATPLITAQPWQLANYRADLIRLSKVGPQPISRWSPTMNKWTHVDWAANPGVNPPIESALRGPFATTVQPISSFGVDSNAEEPDIAASAGYVFTAYIVRDPGATHGTPALVVTDATSGETAWRYVVSNATSRLPRLAVTGDYLVLAWVNDTGASIEALSVTISTIKAAAPTANVTLAIGGTAHAANPWFDVIADGLNVAMAWRTSTNKTFGAEFTPSSGAHANYEIKTAASASIDPEDGLAFVQNPVGYANVGIVTAGHTTGFVVVNAGFRGTGVSAQTHTVDITYSSIAQKALVAGVFTTASATAEVNVLSSGNTLRFAQWSGGVAGSMLFANSVFLASKMFNFGGVDNFAIVQHISNNFKSYYLMRVPVNMATTPGFAIPAPLAKLMPGDAAGMTNPTSVVSIASPVGATSVAALRRFSHVQIDAASFPIQTQFNGIADVTISTDPILGNAVEAADALYVPGAQLTVFDGQSYADDGAPYIPDIIFAQSAVGVGLTPGQVFRYVNVTAYVDANGRLNRSAPSIPVQTTVAPAQGKITVKGAHVGLTQRFLAYTGRLVIETYKTKDVNAGANPNVYYLLNVHANDITTDTYTFDDVTADPSTGEPLYTNAGVLPNDVTPGFSALAVFQSRLFGASMDFGSADSWYTTEFADGLSPRWSESFVVKGEDSHGRIYGYAVLDDKLVVFKRGAIYVIAGQGADVLGNGATYRMQIVTAEHGCVNPRSIVATADGVWFQSTSSRANMLMLTRSLQIDDQVGAPMRQYTEAVTASILVAEQSQVRFYTSSGRTLVYDLVAKAWSTYTGQPATAATCWAGSKAAYGRTASDVVVVEDLSGSNYLEAGTWFGIHAVPPLMQLSQLNGYERFFRIQGVGETAGAHVLRIRLYQDGNAAPMTDQFVAPGAAWDWETRFSRKLSALRIVIDEVQVANIIQSAGPKMTALVLEVGVKAGLKRLPSANRSQAT